MTNNNKQDKEDLFYNNKLYSNMTYNTPLGEEDKRNSKKLKQSVQSFVNLYGYNFIKNITAQDNEKQAFKQFLEDYGNLLFYKYEGNPLPLILNHLKLYGFAYETFEEVSHNITMQDHLNAFTIEEIEAVGWKWYDEFKLYIHTER